MDIEYEYSFEKQRDLVIIYLNPDIWIAYWIGLISHTTFAFCLMSNKQIFKSHLQDYVVAMVIFI
jgi:hypothetical protein